MPKHYCYRVFKNGSMIEPVNGGSLKAESMDDAVSIIVRQCKLTYHSSSVHFSEETGWATPIPAYWTKDGKKVSIAVWANPSYYKDNTNA